MVVSAHWIQFILFGIMWLLLTGNNILQLLNQRQRGGGTSLSLFLGGFFGAAAAIVCPIEGAWLWFWLPALVDPGSIPAIIYIVSHRINNKRLKKNSKPLN